MIAHSEQAQNGLRSRLVSGLMIVASSCLLIPHNALGQDVSLDVEISAVDTDTGSITVNYKTELGKTSTTLDVSKRASIVINGQIAKLSDLKRGHAAKVAYSKDLEVVSKIEATGSPKVAEFVIASELDGMYPCLTKDGLTVAYEFNNAIWTAQRDSPEGYFTNMKSLFPGRHPAISSDGLEIVFHQKAAGKQLPTLHSAKRDSIDKAFRRATEIQELNSFVDPKGPVLSTDGLTLCFRVMGTEAMAAYSVRSSLAGKWSKPQALISPAAEAKAGGFVFWTWLSEDKLTVLAALEGQGVETKNLYWFTRTKDSVPFTEFRRISDDVIPNMIRCPRFVPATSELFVSGHPKASQPFAIGIIKNFSLPQ